MSTIKVLKGSTKAFEAHARSVVKGGGDLYVWLFEQAPPGFVTFEADCTYGLEYVKGQVWTERVWNPLMRRVETVRHASAELMQG